MVVRETSFAMVQIILNFSWILIMSNIDQGTALNDSLTTAVTRETPKTATIDRLTNIEKDINYRASSNQDALHPTDGRRKMNTRSYIWKWDHWCQLQPKRGNCEKSLTKYFYDVKLDQCSSFIYSGCDGNKNNFDTLLDCDRHCKGTNYMTIEDSKQPTFCFLQPEAGLCIALFTKYYYDVNENTCKQFIYGGCGGNQNKFDTMFSCMKTCKGKI